MKRSRKVPFFIAAESRCRPPRDFLLPDSEKRLRAGVAHGFGAQGAIACVQGGAVWVRWADLKWRVRQFMQTQPDSGNRLKSGYNARLRCCLRLHRIFRLSKQMQIPGAIAKRLCNGLQIRLVRFDSGSRLQNLQKAPNKKAAPNWAAFFVPFVWSGGRVQSKRTLGAARSASLVVTCRGSERVKPVRRATMRSGKAWAALLKSSTASL